LTAVFKFDEVGSTNTVAAEKLQEGERPPFWIVAGRQTQGRGRTNRNWISQPGNLYASFAFSPLCRLQDLPQLSFVVGIAVYEAISAVAPNAKLQLKWPNDCLAHGAKISGILIENPGLTPLLSIVGCGINVASAPENLNYPTTAICHFAPVSVQTVFRQLQSELPHWLSRWKAGEDFETIRQAWLARSAPIGKHIEIRTGPVTSSGTFRGIDHRGALLLESSAGTISEHFAGDLMVAN
jgi:BirA family transcriptional regulator, biotin operon repressor / biotin---[acetyl-CoA-carboxylase] ligase